MNTAVVPSRNSETTLLIACIPTILIVLFLFYIDEGWYSFRWMRDAGNWIVFVIYLALLFPFQWIIAQFCFRRQQTWSRILCTTLTGIVLTLGVFLLWVF